MNNEEIREKILTEAMADLKSKAGEVISGIMSELYTDYLPHVVSDTESNIAYRVEGCIANLIAGNIRESGNHAWVKDGYGHEHMITLSSYSGALKPLCDLMGETIQSNRIKQLEARVSDLESMLRDRYR